MKQSKLEATFTTRYLQTGRHSLLPEYIFDKPDGKRKKRMWRFDFANPESKVGVELDGGEHSSGRHVRPQGFISDCEKMNAATMQGWAVLRFPGSVFKADEVGCIELVDSLIDIRLPLFEKDGTDRKASNIVTVSFIEPVVTIPAVVSLIDEDAAA